MKKAKYFSYYILLLSLLFGCSYNSKFQTKKNFLQTLLDTANISIDTTKNILINIINPSDACIGCHIAVYDHFMKLKNSKKIPKSNIIVISPYIRKVEQTKFFNEIIPINIEEYHYFANNNLINAFYEEGKIKQPFSFFLLYDGYNKKLLSVKKFRKLNKNSL